MAQLLEAGINVISTANFITGRSFGQAAVDRLESASRKGGVTLHGTGINPGLANAYAQTLGTVFTEMPKPYEVEIVVAEIGDVPSEDQLYRLTFDGSVADEQGYVAMGGQAEAITTALEEQWTAGMQLADALKLAVALLGEFGGDTARSLEPESLEVAVLDRNRPRRTFVRINGSRLSDLLA